MVPLAVISNAARESLREEIKWDKSVAVRAAGIIRQHSTNPLRVLFDITDAFLTGESFL
jgi:hypothetical protein